MWRGEGGSYDAELAPTTSPFLFLFIERYSVIYGYFGGKYVLYGYRDKAGFMRSSVVLFLFCSNSSRRNRIFWSWAAERERARELKHEMQELKDTGKSAENT